METQFNLNASLIPKFNENLSVDFINQFHNVKGNSTKMDIDRKSNLDIYLNTGFKIKPGSKTSTPSIFDHTSDSSKNLSGESNGSCSEYEELDQHISAISIPSTTWDGCVSCRMRQADTCIVHQHPESHDCFCFHCATYHFHSSGTCPLCNKSIVYIYKYDNI